MWHQASYRVLHTVYVCRSPVSFCDHHLSLGSKHWMIGYVTQSAGLTWVGPLECTNILEETRTTLNHISISYISFMFRHHLGQGTTLHHQLPQWENIPSSCSVIGLKKESSGGSGDEEHLCPMATVWNAQEFCVCPSALWVLNTSFSNEDCITLLSRPQLPREAKTWYVWAIRSCHKEKSIWVTRSI